MTIQQSTAAAQCAPINPAAETEEQMKTGFLPADLARHLENRSVHQGQEKPKGWHLCTWNKKSRSKGSPNNP